MDISYQPSITHQLSHELRIPLTGILGMAELLEQTTLTQEQTNYLNVIRLSATRLLTLENTLHSLLASK